MVDISEVPMVLDMNIDDHRLWPWPWQGAVPRVSAFRLMSGISTVKELCEVTEQKICSYPGIGVTTAVQIKHMLERHGLNLAK